MMKISVIIPAFNASKTICNTINAIKNQKHLKEAVEIIVVDDGSTDNTQELLLNTSNVLIISQSNAGPATARNTGVKEATGDILVFTDSDTLPRENWLYELTLPFDNPNIMATTGTYAIENKDKPLAQLIQLEIERKHQNYGEFVPFGGTYNLAVRKSLFEKIGGFNQEYKKASGEDNHLCYQINQEGYSIKYVPTAVVGHFHPENSVKYLKTQYTHGFWRAKLYYSFPNKLSGDAYTGLKEILETSSCGSFLFFAILSLLSFFSKNKNLRNSTLMLGAMSFMALGITEIKAISQLIKDLDKERLKVLPTKIEILEIMIFRALSRTLGFIVGLWKFA